MRENPPMIEDRILEKSDIGKEVWYIPDQAKNDFSKWEKGILSSFVHNEDGTSIFVKFRGITGERISQNNLRFVRK
jgi:hypothetical protein